MEPTARSGKSRPGQSEFVFKRSERPDGAARQSEHLNRKDQEENNLGAPVDPFAAGPTQESVERRSGGGDQPAPRWLRRLQSVVFVLVCLQLGLMLVVLPWEPVWNTNVFLLDFPTLHAVLQNLFIRGLVTGLGVVDIWIGIAEAVRYRERN